MKFEGSLREAWDQKAIPIVLRRDGRGEKLRVRVPGDLAAARSWLGLLGRSRPKWEGGNARYWEIPKRWFNKFVDASLRKFGRVLIVQPYNEHEICAYNCRHAQGHECNCSCMGQHHGTESDGGWFDVTEAFSVKTGERHLACRLLVAKGES